jgi:hypothetical protein
MMISRTIRRFAALAAMLGIALQAFWPLIAQARPVLSVPICLAGTPGHSIELPVGKSDASGEHCKLCVLGTDKAIFSPEFAFDLLEGFSQQKSVSGEKSLTSSSVLQARSRAPPAVS